MAAFVPDLALSGWNGLVSLDVGAGAGFFSRYKFGAQDFGGPVQIVATAGIRVNPFCSAYVWLRVQHSPTQESRGRALSAWIGGDLREERIGEESLLEIK